MSTSEQESIQAAIQGDQEALVRLLEAASSSLRAVIASRLPSQWRSRIAVDDVLQQTFTDAFLSMGDFRLVAGYSFQAWLTTIAKRNLADALRMMAADKRGGRHPHTRQGRDQSFDTLLAHICCGGNTPSREVSAEEIRRTLADALEQLPEPHRTVVWQYDIEGQAVSDIAVALQRSAGAIYMLRARAHRWLADQLGRPSDFFSDFA